MNDEMYKVGLGLDPRLRKKGIEAMIACLLAIKDFNPKEQHKVLLNLHAQLDIAERDLESFKFAEEQGKQEEIPHKYRQQQRTQDVQPPCLLRRAGGVSVQKPPHSQGNPWLDQECMKFGPSPSYFHDFDCPGSSNDPPPPESMYVPLPRNLRDFQRDPRQSWSDMVCVHEQRPSTCNRGCRYPKDFTHVPSSEKLFGPSFHQRK